MEKESVKNSIEFDFRTIKTFEDACTRLGINPSNLPDVSMIPDDIKKHVIAYYKLLVIYKAINNGWKPDWSDWNQYKYYHWFEVLSSGFGFSHSYYSCGLTVTAVGSRLCTDTSEKATYIAKQFEAEYKDYLLYSE
ncbi:MAG: hypothetical protein RBU23_12830 [Candidatus Auribacterota bacterium]|jgi:hypothetical protein|nr:hypothetical protein [Candidatus Auribacterota bacterium]